MANVSWNEYLPYVLPEVAKCPREVGRAAIRDAAIEFCRRTGIWRRFSDPTDIIGGQAIYEFVPEEGATVAEVVDIRVLGRLLHPITLDALSRNSGDWMDAESVQPSSYFGLEPGKVQLYPRPEIDMPGALVAQVTLKPSRNSVEGPGWLYEEWGDSIGYGAKAILLSQQSRDWSGDPRLAAGLFENAVGRARGAANRSMTRTNLRAQMRRFI